MAKDIYSLADLAERWHVDRLTVYRLVTAGKIKAFQVGKQWRVTAETVAEYEGRGLAV